MNNKPKLNNARLQSFGNYCPLFDIQLVDEKQKIYKGRPVPTPRGPSPMEQAIEAEWIFFINEYDDRNDWDRLYHQLTLDETFIGTPITLVPKEKLLFKYSSPTTIVLPPVGINFGKRQ